MSNYKKYGFCPFSNQLNETDCGTVCFCDDCDTYFDGYNKGRADERAKCEEHRIEVENLVQELNSRVSELESAVAFLLNN